MPSQLSSDRGAQFTSEVWFATTKLLGIRLHHTSAYHPQANGLVEQLHRQLKNALIARIKGPDWADELPWVLLGIRTAPKDDLQCSSAKLVYGGPLSVLGDFLPSHSDNFPNAACLSWLQSRIQQLTPTPMSHHTEQHPYMPNELFKCQYVFIQKRPWRPPLIPPYEGPFKVKQTGSKTFLIDSGGQAETVSIDQLKPAHTDLLQQVELPLPKHRGRPPYQH